MKILNITDPIYNTDIVVCQGSLEAFNKWCLKNFKDEVDTDKAAGKFVALIHKVTGAERLIIWFEKYDESVILHECLHCAIYLLNNRGIKINSKNDEPFCYYAEWLFRSIRENKAGFNK